MSLLLDARKKLQEAQAALNGNHIRQPSELSLIEHPLEAEPKQAGQKLPDAKPTVTVPPSQPAHPPRSAGQNLFNAKAHESNSSHAPPHRNLLLALGGTVLLLGIGTAYLWYLDSASNAKLPLPAAIPPAMPIAQQPAPVAAGTAQTKLVPGIAAPKTAVAGAIAPTTSTAGSPTEGTQKTLSAATATPDEGTSSPALQARSSPAQPNNNPIRIEQQRIEPVDPLLRAAYLAYHDGKPEEAQQLYLAMFKKDARNPDALLGLATIAQQRGENQMAAQYYARILALDPRNALANAGMSALSADDDRNESHLKNLLREQGNSSALHFALGNLYAGQSRWGEAQQAYFSAYTLESSNAEFAFNLAVSLDHLGQKKLAAQHYQRALELDQARTTGFDHAQASQRLQELMR